MCMTIIANSSATLLSDELIIASLNTQWLPPTEGCLEKRLVNNKQTPAGNFMATSPNGHLARIGINLIIVYDVVADDSLSSTNIPAEEDIRFISLHLNIGIANQMEIGTIDVTTTKNVVRDETNSLACF